MPANKTYSSAHRPPEEPPAPNDPRGYRGPQGPTTPAPPAVLIAGSRFWKPDEHRQVHDYTRRVVQRIKDTGQRLIVGDNPQGVDQAVVAAADELGVDCLVYGTDRQPRNARVKDSQHCRYVQVQKEAVTEISAGGRYNEPRHQRSMQLLTYSERDQRMVDNADRVLAIWNGQSPGTQAVVAYADQQGKAVDIAMPEDGRMSLVVRSNAPLTDPTAPSPPAPVPDAAPDVTTINGELANDPAYTAFTDQTLDIPPQPSAGGPDLEDLIIYSQPDLTAVAQELGFQAMPLDVLSDGGIHLANPIIPALDTQPYYDRDNDTALWIGLVGWGAGQSACVLSVEDAHSATPSAHLTPCYHGDPARAWQISQQLADALDDAPDLSRFQGVVEGMARANRVHWDWGNGQGLPLDDDVADRLGLHVQGLDID